MDTTRVKDALWPEAAGVGVLMLANVVAATQDATAADKAASEGKEAGRPMWQMLATGGGLAAGGYMVAKGKMPDLGKGLLYGGVGIIFGNLGRKLYEQIKEKPEGTTSSVLALIAPQSARSLSTLGAGATSLKMLMPGVPASVQSTSRAPIKEVLV